MRLGVLLPTFRETPRDALTAADEAAAAGLDGVFAYDHLWPMGSPDRPALAPFEVLAAVAATHPSLVVGPLVARVGLVADEVLLGQCRALRTAALARVVLALGTGDRLSKEENLAYGIGYADATSRRASLRAIAEALLADGAEVWVGSGGPATQAVATELGCALNLWDADPEVVAAASRRGPVTWAGSTPRHGDAVDEARADVLLAQLRDAGAGWAVFDPRMPPQLLARLGR
jgi:hypothetical protein